MTTRSSSERGRTNSRGRRATRGESSGVRRVQEDLDDLPELKSTLQREEPSSKSMQRLLRGGGIFSLSSSDISEEMDSVSDSESLSSSSSASHSLAESSDLWTLRLLREGEGEGGDERVEAACCWRVRACSARCCAINST